MRRRRFGVECVQGVADAAYVSGVAYVTYVGRYENNYYLCTI